MKAFTYYIADKYKTLGKIPHPTSSSLDFEEIWE